MRKIYKTFVFVATVVSIVLLIQHENYCEQEMELIGSGGQSNIYSCGHDVVKLYRVG